MIKRALIALLLATIFSAAVAQTNTRLESHWAAGPCKEICLTDNYAFASFGGTLTVIDLATQTLVATLSMPQTIQHMAVRGETLYLTQVNGLYSVDITDVHAMRPGFCTADAVGKLIVRDNLLFAAGNKSIRIYDISAPMTAALLGSVDVPEYTWDIALNGDHLYYAAYNAGIGVVDVSDPAAPQKTGLVPASRNAYCIAACGEALYVGFNYREGADIFSLADPATPVLSKTLSERYFCDMERVANTLFVAARDFGAHSMDVTDPLNPTHFIDYDFGNVQRIAANSGTLGVTDLLSGVNLFHLDAQQTVSTSFSYDVDVITLIMYTHRTTVYLSDKDKGLKILDCSDPNNIQDHGFVAINAADIFFSDDVAYMARGMRAAFWNVANANAPAEIRSFDMPEFRDRVFIHDDYAIFYSGDPRVNVNYGVTILDVQDLMHPKVMSSVTFEGPVKAAAAGQALFVIDRHKQLYRVNITDVQNPVIDPLPLLPDSVVGFWTHQDIGYCSTVDDSLIIFDLHDPFQPQQKTKMHCNMFWNKPLFYGQHAYTGAFLGMTVYDFSDPYAPRRTGFLPISGYFASPAIMGDNLVVLKVIMENKIAFYNLSTPNSPQKLGCINLTGASSAVAAKEKYAFVANNSGGLRVLDLSRQEQQEIDAVIARNDVVDVAVQGDFAYLAVTVDGLYVIDIADPARARVVGHYYPSTNSNVNEVLVSGNYAYLIGGVYHLSVIDVSEPAQPQLVGQTSASYFSGDGDVGDGCIYLADINEGMKVYDVHDPQNPLLIGEAAIKGAAYDVCLHDHYAYVAVAYGATNPSAIHIFDVSVPAAPVKVDSVQVQSADFRALAKSDDYLIAAAASKGAIIFDISTPGKPVNVAQFYTPGNNIIDVAASDGHIYCCDAENGIYRVSLQLINDVLANKGELPDDYWLDNYPNPFNSATTLRYALAKPARVKLAIYNMLGELVRTLTDEPHAAGVYLTRWDGRSEMGKTVASGLYIARLEAGDHRSMIKMLLVR